MKKCFLITVMMFSLSFVFAQQQQKNKNTPTKDPVTVSQKTTSPKKPDYLKLSIQRGKIVYTKECLTCHQEDGSGVPSMNPPLIKTPWVLGKKSDLIRFVMKGSSGQVEIDGDTFHNVMASHSNLTDRQIADVLTYIRNSFGNKAIAVNAAEVKSVRATMK